MASYKTLMLPLLQELLVKEIGEANLQPLKWTKKSPTEYKFLVDINDYTEVVTVNFEQFEDKIQKQHYFPPKYRNLDKVYNVGYTVSGDEIQFTKSTIKTLLIILSTIVDIVKDFVDKNDVEGLYIKGTPKDIGNSDISKKSNLYKAFIQKQLQQISNFGFDTHRDGFILIKIK